MSRPKQNDLSTDATDAANPVHTAVPPLTNHCSPQAPHAHDPHAHNPHAHDPHAHAHDPHAHAHDPHAHDPHAHDPHAHDVPDHAHDHEHAHDPTRPHPSGTFPHEKLDAYRVALRLAVVAKRLADSIPRGHRNLADHLLRAATNVPLLLAEGANRRGAGEKRQRFVESRGECGEAASCADVALALEVGSRIDADSLRDIAARVSAMLTGLIGRLE
jgi:four helix bundle protein